MNLLFWKKKKQAPEEEGEGARDAAEEQTMLAEAGPETGDAQPRTGLLAKLAAIGQRFRRNKAEAPEPEEESTADEDLRKKNSDTPDEEDSETRPAAHAKKRLLLIATAMLLVLLLAGGGLAAWKWLRPAPAAQEAKAPPTSVIGKAKVPAPAEAPQPLGVEHQATPTVATAAAAPANMDIQAQIEALKKQNQEMQAQIEALKNQNAQQPSGYAPVARSGKTGSTPLPQEGVLIINGKDTKASAQALKQVIEEMNASEGRGAKK